MKALTCTPLSFLLFQGALPGIDRVLAGGCTDVAWGDTRRERDLRTRSPVPVSAIAASTGLNETRREACDAGDLPSVEALYDRYVPFVWRNARRMGVREADIEDVTQEVFLVVHRRRGEFERRSSAETWLFGILFHVVQHYRRSTARWLRKLEALVRSGGSEQEATGVAEPLDALVQRDRAALLERMLHELDDSKRAVFLLVELEEQTVPAVAEALGMNVNTVYSRLRAARLELEKVATRMSAAAGKERP